MDNYKATRLRQMQRQRKKQISLWLCTCFILNMLIAGSAQAVVVLQYHHIADDTPFSTSTKVDLFKKQMDWLYQNNFRVIGWPELKGLLDDKKTLPDKTVLITFDDGYQSVLTNAVPILEKYRFPYIIFVNPGLIADKDSSMIGWHSLKRLSKNGATIANHSLSHPYLINRLADENESAWTSRVTFEIESAEQLIMKKIGRSSSAIAWPYGEYNPQLKQIAKRLFLYAFTQQSGVISKHSDMQALPRFPMGAGFGKGDDFEVKLNAKAMPVVQSWIQLKNDQKRTTHNLKSEEKPIALLLQIARQINKQSNKQHLLNLSCFYQGQHLVVKRLKQNLYRITLPAMQLQRRQRINCTSPSNQVGRFYWYSYPLFFSWLTD